MASKLTTVEWMWGDVSLIGHVFAQKNPLRWSSPKSPLDTIAELQAVAAKDKYDANRPIELRVKKDGGVEKLFPKNVQAAIDQLLQEDPLARGMASVALAAAAPAADVAASEASKAATFGAGDGSAPPAEKASDAPKEAPAGSQEATPGVATLILPDGRKHTINVLTGKLGNDTFLDIRDLYAKTQCFTFDPGFTCTSSCMSAVTFTDGEKGICLYRGYPVGDLCEKSTTLESAYLLLHGELPTVKELSSFTKDIKENMLVHGKVRAMFDCFGLNSHPMAIMVTVIGGLSTVFSELDSSNETHRNLACIRLIAKVPVLAAIAYKTSIGQRIVFPRDDLDFAENWLSMMFATPMKEYRVNPIHAKAIDAFMILHMDHEQNASTSTVRTAGSSQANPYACIAAGVASLWGPAHGGANEAVIKMLETIGTVDNVPQFVQDVKDKKEGVRLMGFGHRVYKNYDPRAKVMKKLVDECLGEMGIVDPLLAIAQELEAIALSDEYFVKRKLYPNVDYYSGILLRAIGIPTSMFTVMFAMARTVGWMSQWNEMVTEGQMRITRPRQIYIGSAEREYQKPIAEEASPAFSEDESPIKKRQSFADLNFTLPDCVTR